MRSGGGLPYGWAPLCSTLRRSDLRAIGQRPTTGTGAGADKPSTSGMRSLPK